MQVKNNDSIAGLDQRIEYINRLEGGRMNTGELDILEMVRNALTDAIKASGLSRYKIAAVMSEVTGKDISKHMLDKWTAESSTYHRFPAELVPAFCYATHDSHLLRVLATPLACEVKESSEALQDHLHNIQIEIGELQQLQARLKLKLNKVTVIDDPIRRTL